MAIIKKMRKEEAVYWAPTGRDGYGVTTFAAPVEMKVRWEDTTELIIDNKGKEVVSQARVYVDRENLPNGYLFRGTLDDLDDLDSDEDKDDPTTIRKAFEILKFDNLPKLNYRDFLLTSWL